jgi:hypothetical protein
MNFAVIADLAIEPDEHLWVYYRTRADARAILDDRVSANEATIADDGARPDDTVRPEENVGPDGGIRMHYSRRMALSPLREAIALCIEIFEQSRHAHSYAGNREAAGIALVGGVEGSVHLPADDQYRRPMQQRFSRLFRSARIHQASAQRFFRSLAMPGRYLQIAPEKSEHVGMMILDRLTSEH